MYTFFSLSVYIIYGQSLILTETDVCSWTKFIDLVMLGILLLDIYTTYYLKLLSFELVQVYFMLFMNI